MWNSKAGTMLFRVSVFITKLRVKNRQRIPDES
jgi:hypothetical protein